MAYSGVLRFNNETLFTSLPNYEGTRIPLPQYIETFKHFMDEERTWEGY